MPTRRFWFLATLSAALTSAAAFSWGCGGAPVAPGTSPRAKAPQELGPFLSLSCERAHPSKGAVREGSVRQGSTVALARDHDRLIAYVADRDRNRVAVVDVHEQKVQELVSVFGAPEQVEVLADGRVVVTIGDGRHIEVFEPTGDAHAPLERLCAREVPAGPFALATSLDDRSLLVTSAWEPSLSVFDLAMHRTSTTPLDRAPRGVIADGHNKAFVSHLVGAELSVVDLADPTHAPLSIPLGLKAGSPFGANVDLNVRRKGSQAYSLVSVDIHTDSRPARNEEQPRASDSGPESNTPLRGSGPSPTTVIAPKKPSSVAETPIAVEAPPAAPPPVEAQPTSRIIVPMVSVNPGDENRPTEFYYGPPPVAGVPKQAPVAVVVDPVAKAALTSHVVSTTGNLRARECILPRSAAVSPTAEVLYVTCLGLDEMLELDARAADPMRAVRRRFEAPKGPTGVAIAAKENIAVVFGQFEGSLGLIPLDGSPQSSVDLTGGDVPNNSILLDPMALRGRAVFYRSDDRRITAEGLSCSSCHPDGSEDGLTWFTPEGPRQTPMLAGRLPGTQPFGWTRNQPTLDEYISETCRRLGGRGLEAGEVGELAAYVRRLPGPPRAIASSDAITKGKEVFFGKGCNGCHNDGVGTDRSKHAVDGKTQVDTPSLRDVALTAPYFHDGRYATLEALLSDTGSAMGATASLTADERALLRAYLGSL